MQQIYGVLVDGKPLMRTEQATGFYPVTFSDEPTETPEGYHTVCTWQQNGSGIYQLWDYELDSKPEDATVALSARLDELEAALVEVADTIGGTDTTDTTDTTEGGAE
jgi:hypothetical protein